MAKQAATFVRDLRRMVANARRDISVSAQDLGIDEEDLRTLRELRNPRAFMRDKILDGVDLDDLGLDGGEADGNGAARGDGTTRRGGGQRGSGAQRGSAAPRSGAGGPSRPTADVPYDPDAT